MWQEMFEEEDTCCRKIVVSGLVQEKVGKQEMKGKEKGDADVNVDEDRDEKQDEEEATCTNSVETELDSICNNVRQMLSLMSELSVQENVSKEVIDALRIRFERLFDLCKEEDYGDDHSIVKAIRKGFNACVYDRNLDLASHELESAMKNILTFDIEGMLKLFGKTIEASKQVAGKDICLVLGRTGAGKSTTIHFLTGPTMVQDATTGHIQPVKVTNEFLKKIKTDFRVAASVTRS